MLGFVLVGCGRISTKHADALISNQVKNATLVAVCDVIESRAKSVAEKYQVPYFTDMHTMMKSLNDKVDVVSILTPSGMHADHCIALSQYKKHIVVEKPMALTTTSADEMIKACNAAGVRLFIVKQNRYNLPVIKLREALAAGRFGKLVLGSVRVRWSRDQKYYDQDSWRGTWALDGGVFTNQASHHIDLLIWMMGEVESVYAKSITALVKIEAEDTGIAILKFTNGALGVIEATTATRPKDLEGSVSILGERGSVEVGGFAVNKMKTWNFIDNTPDDELVIAKFHENPPNVYGFGHVAFLNHVVECIVNKKPAPVDGQEGRKSLDVINAIYESIETGKEVFVGSKPRINKLGTHL